MPVRIRHVLITVSSITHDGPCRAVTQQTCMMQHPLGGFHIDATGQVASTDRYGLQHVALWQQHTCRLTAAAALGEQHLGAGEEVAAGGGHVHDGVRAPRQHLRLAPKALLQRQRDCLPLILHPIQPPRHGEQVT